MKSIHVLRKPCAESTVAANVLRYGTGALNIGESRIGNWQTRLDPACNKGATGRARFNTLGPVNTTGYTNSETKNGRWPANLVLQHLDGCVQDGVKKVKVIGATEHRKEHGTKGLMGWEGQPHTGFRDPDGTETVAAWACAEGCPVAGLDGQSGISQSASGVVKYVRAETSGWRERGGSFTPGHTWEAQAYGDKGGASRFFKQMQNGTAERTTPTPDPPTLPDQVQTEAQ